MEIDLLLKFVDRCELRKIIIVISLFAVLLESLGIIEIDQRVQLSLIASALVTFVTILARKPVLIKTEKEITCPLCKNENMHSTSFECVKCGWKLAKPNDKS